MIYRASRPPSRTNYSETAPQHFFYIHSLPGAIARRLFPARHSSRVKPCSLIRREQKKKKWSKRGKNPREEWELKFLRIVVFFFLSRESTMPIRHRTPCYFLRIIRELLYSPNGAVYNSPTKRMKRKKFQKERENSLGKIKSQKSINPFFFFFFCVSV